MEAGADGRQCEQWDVLGGQGGSCKGMRQAGVEMTLDNVGVLSGPRVSPGCLKQLREVPAAGVVLEHPRHGCVLVFPCFPSVWKRRKSPHMPLCASPCRSSRRSTPTCHQLHSAEESPRAQCRGSEPAPGPWPAPAAYSASRTCMGCTRRAVGCLSLHAGASWTVELLLL